MKEIFVFFTWSLFLGFCSAQSINLQEIMQTPPLYDSRNGATDLGDIDNDGDQDLMVIGKQGNLHKATLYTNDGSGNFTEVTGTPFPGVEFGCVGFEDVDNDGDQDLLLTGRFGSQFFANLYLNNGSGGFTLAPSTPFEPITGVFEFADVDNDGDQDVLMVGVKITPSFIQLAHTALYLNNGSGVFTVASGNPFEQVNGSLAFIDIDNDNDKDVLISGKNDSDVLSTKLYENNGSGSFTFVNNTPFEAVGSPAIGVADSDNDGDEDVLLSGLKAGGVRVANLYTNDGTGTFSLVPGTPFPPCFIGTVDFADFDNDGDFDVLITGATQGSAFVGNIYENQGANNFVQADSVASVYLSSTALADIDGDSDTDAIIVGISNTSNTFNTRTFLNQFISPQPFFADSDNDSFGDPSNSLIASIAPAGYVSDSTDCDDTDNTVYPGAPELCDGLDNDCNGQIDEAGCNCDDALQDVKAVVVNDTKVVVSWAPAPNAYRQRIQYRVQGTASWQTILKGGYPRNLFFLPGLSPNTTYEYRVRQQCLSQNGPYSPIQTFTTYSADPCSTPSDMTYGYLFNGNPSKVRVYCNYEPSATKYQIRWKPTGNSSYTFTQRTKAEYVFSGLSPDTEYSYSWRAYCSGSWTTWLPDDNFLTLNGTLPLPQLSAQRTDFGQSMGKFSISPNPAADRISIDFGGNIPSNIRVFNTFGQRVLETAGSFEMETLDISHLSKGTYFMQCIWNNGNTHSSSFVKQ